MEQHPEDDREPFRLVLMPRVKGGGRSTHEADLFPQMEFKIGQALVNSAAHPARPPVDLVCLSNVGRFSGWPSA